MIKTWSFSRWKDFEQCKFRAYLKYVQKVPEPDRPLPPGVTEHAIDRGSRIHECSEKFIRGGVELIPELETYREELEKLKELYSAGKVAVEEEWAMDTAWEPCAWGSETTWLRLKLDAFAIRAPGKAVVIDIKTGRKSGNEIKHAEQGQLYQLVAFMRNPEIQQIDVEFWYTDKDEMSHMKFTRTQGMRFFKSFDDKGKIITSCTEFPPSPSIFTCRWCPYNGNACTKGVKK